MFSKNYAPCINKLTLKQFAVTCPVHNMWGQWKFLLIRELFTNLYKTRPILLFCKCALLPGGKRQYGIWTSHLTCKQWYDKTREETEINFLINAYFSALMGPGFSSMSSGDGQYNKSKWCWQVDALITLCMDSVMAANMVYG